MYIAISNSIGSSSRVNGGGGGGGFTNTYSLAFDGVDDYIQLSSAMSTSGTDWSISCWFKSSQSGGNRVLVGYPGSKYFGINFGRLTFWSSDNSFDMTSSFNVNDGNWHNAIYTYNYTTGAWKNYIDGVIEDDQTATTGINIPPWSFFGARSSVQYFTECNLDEIAYFSTELSVENVASIYNSGVPNDLTSLNPTAWYRMGDNGSYKSPQWLIPENSNVANSRFSNYSFQYDGVDDYINCGTDSSLKPTSAYSVSGWFKLDDLTGTKTIISNDNNNGYMSWVANDKLWFYHYDTSWRTITSNTTLVANTWYHFALTWDLSSTTGKMYINGVYDNQNTSFNQVTYLSTPVYIGTYGPSVYFEGNIDDIAVFNKVLTPTEITSIYNSGVPNDISSLSPVAYYKMGEEATFVYNVNPEGTWTIPDAVGSSDGTSNNTFLDTGRVGDAPNSTSNAISFNMLETDRKEDTPPTP